MFPLDRRECRSCLNHQVVRVGDLVLWPGQTDSIPPWFQLETYMIWTMTHNGMAVHRPLTLHCKTCSSSNGRNRDRNGGPAKCHAINQPHSYTHEHLAYILRIAGQRHDHSRWVSEQEGWKVSQALVAAERLTIPQLLQHLLRGFILLLQHKYRYNWL